MPRILALLGGLALCAAALAQPGQSIKWTQDISAASAAAKVEKRPLMVYVSGRTEDRPNMDRQRAALEDPTVVRLARRFVPARIQHSQHRQLAQEWNAHNGWLIVFVDPEGRRMDSIDPSGAESMAGKMYQVLTQFNNALFLAELAPKLADEKTPAGEIQKILSEIESRMILIADQPLLKLLEREKLDPRLRGEIYNTLAVLSTQPAVDFLFERALEDKAAAAALERCTPDAAEKLMDKYLTDADAAKRLLTYKAVTKICKIGNARPDRFWEGDNPSAKADELARVRDAVRKTSKRWSEQNEYR